MNGGKEHPLPAPPPPNKADDAIPELVDLLGKFDWANDVVDRCAKTILNDNSTITELGNAVQELKQLLCTSRDNVFSIAQEVLDSGVLVGLVRLAGDCHMQQQNLAGVPSSVATELRLRAAFCLTNIAAGSDEQTAEVVKAGGVGVMLELLRHPDEVLRRQAIFCLANIAGATSECRLMLAEQATYVSSLKYAMDNSTDYRMEELVGWNLRNMVVLGGPAFEQCAEALDIFTDKVISSVPNYHLSYTLMVNGVATYTSVECNVVNWFKFGPGGSTGGGGGSGSTSYLSSFMGAVGNRAILRFAGEVFSHISRHENGRQYVLDNELVGPVLYLAKFSPTPSVRNYMSEVLVNMCADVATTKSYFYTVGAVCGLSEMLADGFSYSPHQRVLVAKCLWKLAEASRYPEIGSMTRENVVTRAATIETKSDVIKSALGIIQENPGDGGGLGLGNHLHLDAIDRVDALDLETLDLPCEKGRESLLSIAYAIYTEYYGPEEMSLREKCGRLIVAILLNVNSNILSRFFSTDFLHFLINMAEFAAQVDAISVNLDKAETSVTNAAVADVMEALRVGEYLANPETMFLLNTLKLIERVFKEGENMRQEARGIDNPISAMIKYGNGVTRLESCVAQGALPLEFVNDAYRMIEKFAY